MGISFTPINNKSPAKKYLINIEDASKIKGGRIFIVSIYGLGKEHKVLEGEKQQDGSWVLLHQKDQPIVIQGPILKQEKILTIIIRFQKKKTPGAGCYATRSLATPP